MIRKIDMNSAEFIAEFEKTKTFTDSVCASYNFVYNPQADVTEAIQQGLTRNQLIYGKHYCPCFMVIGNTPEEQASSENRLCPCTPALTSEIPQKGACHCTIFCTPEHAQELSNAHEEVVHTHVKGLSKEACEALLKKAELGGDELEALLEAREHGTINFLLVDTREWMEWVSYRIKGTDMLTPTTSFQDAITQLAGYEETPIVVYCYSGSRSAFCQHILKRMGFKSVSNLEYGIMSYGGESESGE